VEVVATAPCAPSGGSSPKASAIRAIAHMHRFLVDR
jgi:hypothetical protein